MSEGADSAEPEVRSPEVIGEDLPCVRCGYNLRGLDVTGTCPECGGPVEASRSGDLLRFADVGWLTRIFRGSRWIEICSLALAWMAALALILVLRRVAPQVPG